MKLMFDFPNLCFRNLYLNQVNPKSSNPNLEFWVYLLFDQIMKEVNKTSSDHQKEVIVALDDPGNSWRKTVFPEYKADRKKDEDVNWEQIFDYLNKFTNDLKLHTPWRVMQVPGCEADDVIAVLARSTEESSIVYSGDIDFVQLVSDNVMVWNPHYEKFMSFPDEVKIANGVTLVNDVQEFLELSILTGQGGKDNVPNIRTPTGHEGRKPPFGLKKAIKALDDEGIEKYADNENYLRNKQLIDLSQTPDEIQNRILEYYNEYTPGDPDLTSILDKYSWPSYMQKAAEVQTKLEATNV